MINPRMILLRFFDVWCYDINLLIIIFLASKWQNQNTGNKKVGLKK
jgi:hypothetical protein